MANHKAGYLRYKCKSCGALVRIGCPDAALFMKKVAANDGDNRYGVHECDTERLGLTELIGCTFDEGNK